MKLRSQTLFIVVHSSATFPEMDVDAETIRQWHTKERGWRDIGYHSVITRDGSIQEGRDYHAVGAHVKGYNEVSVGTCLVGGINKHNDPEFNFTEKQMKSLKRELQWLKTLFPDAMVVGHRDLDPSTACPSFDVRKWLESENLLMLL